MSGVFPTATGSSWRVSGATPFNRCSQPSQEPGSASNLQGQFSPRDFFRGITLSIPGKGEQKVLTHSPENTSRPTDGNVYTRTTRDFWQLRCLSGLANGFPGEGYLAVAPDGTRYWFNWMVSRPYSTVVRPNRKNPQGDADRLAREEVRLYATRVEDRFGNWVTYGYSGARLVEIRSNDGRLVSLSYNAQGHVSQITAHGRTWSYSYTYNGPSGILNRVTLPDGSFWTFSGTAAPGIVYKTPDPTDAAKRCDELGDWHDSTTVKTFTVGHPSGASATFEYAPIRHARSNVYPMCFIADGELEFGPAILFDTYALIRKTISGPNLNPLTWRVN